MSSLSITKKEIIEIQDANGYPIVQWTPILLRIKTEDIVCRFKGLEGGYFVTVTLDNMHENKYRLGSIEKCTRIEGIADYKEEN